MTRRIPSFLRANRKRWGLTLYELGLLLGVSADAMGKYERGERPIPAGVLIACEFIFAISGAELFPGLYTGAVDALSAPLDALHVLISVGDTNAGKRKAQLLAELKTRLTQSP